MSGMQARALARWAVLGAAATAAAVVPAGAAHADEYNDRAHNGPRVGLVNAGQIDDPMEDVLEHFLLLGDGYVWD